MMKKITGRIRNWRDKAFLKRLERVLDNNTLETNILFRGRIGGTYSVFLSDKKRDYDAYAGWRDGYTGEELAKPDARFEAIDNQ